MYSSGNREVVTSLDAATGRSVWEFPYEADTSGLDLSHGSRDNSVCR
jgi:outer membrane protein assembly factor BamB